MNRQQRVVHVVALVVIGVCLLASPGVAQDCPELVGRLQGGVWGSVAASGDVAYLGTSVGLLIADVSDPSAPRIVGGVDLPAQVSDLAVSGGYAYVTTLDWDSRERGLRVIDVSTPSAPVEVGFLDGVGGAIAVSGNYAYVASRSAGFRVIDVTTPSAPVEVGFLEISNDWLLGVAVSGNFAYVTYFDWNSGGGLRVIDVSTPSAPVEVGSVGTPARAVDVAVSGHYAYVAEEIYYPNPGGLRVIDVRRPSAPVEVGFVEMARTEFYHLAVSGGYAYVTYHDWNSGRNGLRVIDVSWPSAPVKVGHIDTPSRSGDVAVSGDYAYVAVDDGEVRVIDVSWPSAPVVVGFVHGLLAWQVAVSDGYAYVVAWYGGLYIIDVSTPSAPVEAGSLSLEAAANGSGVAILDGYAYVTDLTALRVIDVTTPSEPVEVGFVDWSWTGHYFLSTSAVAVQGAYAYVVVVEPSGLGNDYSLRVIDVSTPSTPAEVGFVELPGEVQDVAVSGGYAYVVDLGGGLRVIDVSTPSAPVAVGFIDTPGYAENLAVSVSDGYAYVAAGNAGLRVIDLSTPATPVEVGFIDTPGYAEGVAVSDGYAYVADGSGGLRVIDVTAPSAPVEVGFMADWANDVAVDGGYVFLASGGAGLYIFSECTREVIPDDYDSFVPAAAVAAGAEGAFFQTDLELNNTGADEAEVVLHWLPRGEDNSEPVSSEAITLAPGASLRFDNVLTEVFGLEPDSRGALMMVASTASVIGMSRTYNLPGGKAAGTFGQGLSAVRTTDMIEGTTPQRILFLSEDDDSRANVGCVNGTSDPLRINVGIFDDEGSLLESRTMDLGPWSNNQLNRVFEDYAPVNGYVDVWGNSEDALFTCYGSMLDNLTSDPTTILPQVPSSDTIFIPAAALAAGLEGAFFTTDVDLNNVGSDDITYEFLWLPRGADNSELTRSETFSLAAGSGVRYANVLGEVFGLEPDQVGALEIEASGTGLLAMSRTYNTPPAKSAGTFGQGLPGVPADRMITTGVTKRIIFMSEDDDFRANLGCVNSAGAEVVVAIDLYDSDGAKLETRYMVLQPYSNWQFNGIFQDYAPVNGYVEVRTNTPEAAFTCYGSVLDNLTSDPTTVLPQ